MFIARSHSYYVFSVLKESAKQMSLHRKGLLQSTKIAKGFQIQAICKESEMHREKNDSKCPRFNSESGIFAKRTKKKILTIKF